jgi:predicted ATP-grasp superfamily ATP-dependent carboligase
VSQTSLRNALGKRFNIEYIDYPDYKDLSIRKTGEGWEIAAEYDEVVPLVYNVSLLVDFEQSVVIP